MLPQEEVLGMVPHFKPFPHFFCDGLIIMEYLPVFVVYISHPLGNSPIDIHLH